MFAHINFMPKNSIHKTLFLDDAKLFIYAVSFGAAGLVILVAIVGIAFFRLNKRGTYIIILCVE